MNSCALKALLEALPRPIRTEKDRMRDGISFNGKSEFAPRICPNEFVVVALRQEHADEQGEIVSNRHPSDVKRPVVAAAQADAIPHIVAAIVFFWIDVGTLDFWRSVWGQKAAPTNRAAVVVESSHRQPKRRAARTCNTGRLLRLKPFDQLGFAGELSPDDAELLADLLDGENVTFIHVCEF
jgi:hypothetical protein